MHCLSDSYCPLCRSNTINICHNYHKLLYSGMLQAPSVVIPCSNVIKLSFKVYLNITEIVWCFFCHHSSHLCHHILEILTYMVLNTISEGGK